MIALLQAKRRFIVPTTIFFTIWFFALPILVGYAPDFMSQNVFGNFTVAYLFALSEFVMTGVIVAIYLRKAKHYDTLAAAIRAKVEVTR